MALIYWFLIYFKDIIKPLIILSSFYKGFFVTYPTLILSNGCCGIIPPPSTKTSFTRCVPHIAKLCIALDSIALIASLAFGILGLLSTIGVPAAAAYASLGASAAICSLWVLFVTLFCIRQCKDNG